MTSPSPTADLSRGDWRSRAVVAVLAMVWVVLAGRLVQLQWIGGTALAHRADRQRTSTETIPARPGEIVDRQGRLLATTVTARSLFLVPNRVSHPWPVALALSEVLGLDPDRLFERIAVHREKHFLWVKRRLEDDEVRRVRELALPPEMWGFREEYLRRYPQGQLAAHVLGLRDIDGKGRGGLEQSLDAVLRGQDGRRVLVRDARGKVMEVRDEVAEAPRHGRSVVLTLDAVIQLYAERELDALMSHWKPRSASAIVLDPQTCEVLAMASRPAFDPNDPAGVPSEAWKNTALSSMYEPGSTFKPLVVAWALEKEVIRRDEVFDCENGAYRMGRRVLRDHHPYGRLSVSDILVKSSNIGMAKIGERLGNPELYNAAIGFGFGSRTGIELPGESPGFVHPLKNWTSYSTGSVPMGQEIAVTPLQLIVAQAALSNGGLLMNPRLVLRQTDSLGLLDMTEAADASRPGIASRLIAPETARWIVEGPMAGTVSRGTGRKAQLDDYAVFGKTGTAQKFDRETGTYSMKRHISSFLGGAPADDPRVLILVVVDEPTAGGSDFGGDVAAPAAGRILRKALIHLRVPTRLARKPE